MRSHHLNGTSPLLLLFAVLKRQRRIPAARCSVQSFLCWSRDYLEQSGNGDSLLIRMGFVARLYGLLRKQSCKVKKDSRLFEMDIPFCVYPSRRCGIGPGEGKDNFGFIRVSCGQSLQRTEGTVVPAEYSCIEQE